MQGLFTRRACVSVRLSTAIPLALTNWITHQINKFCATHSMSWMHNDILTCDNITQFFFFQFCCKSKTVESERTMRTKHIQMRCSPHYVSERKITRTERLWALYRTCIDIDIRSNVRLNDWIFAKQSQNGTNDEKKIGIKSK